MRTRPLLGGQLWLMHCAAQGSWSPKLGRWLPRSQVALYRRMHLPLLLAFSSFLKSVRLSRKALTRRWFTVNFRISVESGLQPSGIVESQSLTSLFLASVRASARSLVMQRWCTATEKELLLEVV